MGPSGRIIAIWWNIKINLQKLVDTCEYELPANLQNFMQKDLTEVKNILKRFRGLLFIETPYMWAEEWTCLHAERGGLRPSWLMWLARAVIWCLGRCICPTSVVNAFCTGVAVATKSHRWRRNKRADAWRCPCRLLKDIVGPPIIVLWMKIKLL